MPTLRDTVKPYSGGYGCRQPSPACPSHQQPPLLRHWPAVHEGDAVGYDASVPQQHVAVHASEASVISPLVSCATRTEHRRSTPDLGTLRRQDDGPNHPSPCRRRPATCGRGPLRSRPASSSPWLPKPDLQSHDNDRSIRAGQVVESGRTPRDGWAYRCTAGRDPLILQMAATASGPVGRWTEIRRGPAVREHR